MRDKYKKLLNIGGGQNEEGDEDYEVEEVNDEEEGENDKNQNFD